MKDIRHLAWIALIIVIVGAVNWGLIGLFNLNLVGALLGHVLARLVYIVVGVAAGYLIYLKVVKKVDLLIL
jgi:uncharacterized membrane protein YuzA (DUF378 family)